MDYRRIYRVPIRSGKANVDHEQQVDHCIENKQVAIRVGAAGESANYARRDVAGRPRLRVAGILMGPGCLAN
jgi:hypothetical protein